MGDVLWNVPQCFLDQKTMCCYSNQCFPQRGEGGAEPPFLPSSCSSLKLAMYVPRHKQLQGAQPPLLSPFILILGETLSKYNSWVVYVMSYISNSAPSGILVIVE